MEPEENQRTLIADTARLDVSFVLNTLKYLHKGGRCSGVAALGANLLQLKPCSEVRDGKMGVGKKYRGSLEKCLRAYVDDRLKNREDVDPKRIFVTHSVQDPALVQRVVGWVQELGMFEQVLHTRAGCTISNHCGPD